MKLYSLIAVGGTLVILGFIWHTDSGSKREVRADSNTHSFIPKAPHPWVGASSSQKFADTDQDNSNQKADATSLAQSSTAGQNRTALGVQKPALPRRPAYLEDMFSDIPTVKGVKSEEPPHNSSTLSQNSAEGATDIVDSEPIELELGPGVRLPVAMLDHDAPLTAQEATAKENLVHVFSNEISASLAETGADITDERIAAKIYARAQHRADAQYKVLFGDAAYNQAGMRAAMEAMPTPGAPAGQAE